MRLAPKFCALGLAALACLPAAAAPLLLFDVNTVAGSPTQAGWTPVNRSGINGVSFNTVGTVFVDDRDRLALNTDDVGGDIGNNDMWRDFIFADERLPPGVGGPGDPNLLPPAGLDIVISGLMANARYAVRLWSYDEVSTGLRSMLWNGSAYSFEGDADPGSLNQRYVDFLAFTDANGVAMLEGRVDFANRGPCCNVFVNGFSLQQVPEPGGLALLLAATTAAGFSTARRRSRG